MKLNRSVIQELLASSGIPVQETGGGGSCGALQVEQAWVEAYLPLDPIIKTLERKPGIDAGATAGMNPAALLDELKATAAVDPTTGSVTAVDQAYLVVSRAPSSCSSLILNVAGLSLQTV